MAGFILLWMGVMTLIFLVCSLRVNICFFVIFLSLLLALIFLTVAYWLLADDIVGNAGLASKMLVVSHARCSSATGIEGLTSSFRLPEHAPSLHALPVGGYSLPSCLPPWISQSKSQWAT